MNSTTSLNWKHWRCVQPEGDTALILSFAYSRKLVGFHISIISCWWTKKEKNILSGRFGVSCNNFHFTHLFTYFPMEGEDSELHRNIVGRIIPLPPLKRKCILDESNSIVILKYSEIWELALINTGNTVLVLIICRQVETANFISVKPMIYWK